MKEFFWFTKTIMRSAFAMLIVGYATSVSAQFCPPQGLPDCAVWLNCYTAGYTELPPSFRTFADSCTAQKMRQSVPGHFFGNAVTLPAKNNAFDLSYLYGLPPHSVVTTSPVKNSQALVAQTVRTRDLKRKVQDDVVEPITKFNDRHPACNCEVNAEATASVADPTAQQDLDNCRIHEVTSLPGSHQYASNFIESMATDPHNPMNVYGITSDLSSNVKPIENQAMYISKSTDGGKTWTGIAKVNSNNFSSASEGLRNSISVGPDGKDVVITTQKGAFQVALPQTAPGKNVPEAVVTPVGDKTEIPRVQADPPDIQTDVATLNKLGFNASNLDYKHKGDPLAAGAVKMSNDGSNMVVSYGYFDGKPQLVGYHKENGVWTKNKPAIPPLVIDGYHENSKLKWVKNDPTSVSAPPTPITGQILSVQIDPKNPSSEYVGTTNGAFHLDTSDAAHPKWVLVNGVDGDSAIHGMSTEGGLHLATCGGIYVPSNVKDTVAKKASKTFVFPKAVYDKNGALSYKGRDGDPSHLRAYSIEVDPNHHERVVVTSAQGVYLSKDGGQTWQKAPGLPDCEYAGPLGATKPPYDRTQCSYLKAQQLGQSRKHAVVPGMKDTSMGPVDPDLYPSEYRTAHFTPDGAVVVSGTGGTFLTNPFAPQCAGKN